VSVHRPRRAAIDEPFFYAQWLDSYLIEQGKEAESIWALDESAGATTVDLKGNNGGTYQGGPTLGTPPVVDDGGVSVDFDGVDDAVRVPDDPGIDFGASDSFTIFGWVTFDQSFFDNSKSGCLFGKEGAGGSEYILRVRGGLSDIRVFLGDGNNAPSRTAAPISADTPHLIGVLVDRGAGTFWPILDGGLGTPGGLSDLGSLENASDLYWGERSDGTGFLEGRIDACAVVRHALTGDEIQKIYDVGIDRSNR